MTAAVAAPSDIVAAIESAVADGVDVAQLLDLRLQQTQSSTRSSWRSYDAAQAGVFVADVRRQQRPGAEHGRAQQPVGHHRGRQHPRPRRSKPVTLGNGRTTRAPASGRRGRSQPADRLCRRRLPGEPAPTAKLCSPDTLDPAKVDRQDRRLRPRRQRAHREEPGVRGRGRRRHGARQRDTELAQRRPALRADRPRRRGRRRRDQGVRGDGADATASLDEGVDRPARRRPRWRASRRAARRWPGAATCSSRTSWRPASTCSPPSRPRRATAATGTSSPARRWRPRTSPAWRRW